VGTNVLLPGIKLLSKFAGVYPVACRYVPRDAWYTTLLMSTGLTFGTIASLYGIIDQTQFSVLVTIVVLSAILPTIVAAAGSRRRRPPADDSCGGDVPGTARICVLRGLGERRHPGNERVRGEVAMGGLRLDRFLRGDFAGHSLLLREAPARTSCYFALYAMTSPAAKSGGVGRRSPGF
jgi:hypothetical protein